MSRPNPIATADAPPSAKVPQTPEQERDFAEFVWNLEQLPPEVVEAFAAFIAICAEYLPEHKAEVAS